MPQQSTERSGAERAARKEGDGKEKKRGCEERQNQGEVTFSLSHSWSLLLGRQLDAEGPPSSCCSSRQELGFTRPLPALPGLCPAPLGTWWGMKVVPGPLEGTLRGRYLEPVRILLTSGSAPGEHDGANIHQPTLVIPARCPRRVCASKSLGKSKDRGEKKERFRVLTHPGQVWPPPALLRGEPLALLLLIQVIAFPALRVPSPAPLALQFDP